MSDWGQPRTIAFWCLIGEMGPGGMRSHYPRSGALVQHPTAVASKINRNCVVSQSRWSRGLIRSACVMLLRQTKHSKVCPAFQLFIIPTECYLFASFQEKKTSLQQLCLSAQQHRKSPRPWQPLPHDQPLREFQPMVFLKFPKESIVIEGKSVCT